MRETADAESPRSGVKRRAFVNCRKQIQVQVDVRGWLLDGIREQPRVILAGHRILRSRRRAVVPVTGWKGGRRTGVR